MKHVLRQGGTLTVWAVITNGGQYSELYTNKVQAESELRYARERWPDCNHVLREFETQAHES